MLDIRSTEEKIKQYDSQIKDIARDTAILPFSEGKDKDRALMALERYCRTVKQKILEELIQIRNSPPLEGIFNKKKNFFIEKLEILSHLADDQLLTIRGNSEKKRILPTPFLRAEKGLGKNLCNFCGSRIGTGFSYKISEEEQEILGIRTTKDARFCSQDCFQGYCNDYEKYKKYHEEKKRSITERINFDQAMLEKLQNKITAYTIKINELNGKEREIGLISPEEIKNKKKSESWFFTKILQKLGLVERDDVVYLIQKIKEKKAVLENNLRLTREKVKKVLVSLLGNKQAKKEFLEREREIIQRENEEKELGEEL